MNGGQYSHIIGSQVGPLWWRQSGGVGLQWFILQGLRHALTGYQQSFGVFTSNNNTNTYGPGVDSSYVYTILEARISYKKICLPGHTFLHLADRFSPDTGIFFQ